MPGSLDLVFAPSLTRSLVHARSLARLRTPSPKRPCAYCFKQHDGRHDGSGSCLLLARDRARFRLALLRRDYVKKTAARESRLLRARDKGRRRLTKWRSVCVNGETTDSRPCKVHARHFRSSSRFFTLHTAKRIHLFCVSRRAPSAADSVLTNDAPITRRSFHLFRG